MQAFAEVYGLSEDWAKDFFNRPDTYIQQYFGISTCDDNPNCVDTANRVLRSKMNGWSRSKDKGNILVSLTYIIGSSLRFEEVAGDSPVPGARIDIRKE